jgi:hypothetical protein
LAINGFTSFVSPFTSATSANSVCTE